MVYIRCQQVVATLERKEVTINASNVPRFGIRKTVPYHWIHSCRRWRPHSDWDCASREAIFDMVHALATLWS